MIISTNYKQELENGQDKGEFQGLGQSHGQDLVQHQVQGFGTICCNISL